jgi:hypothetical protein
MLGVESMQRKAALFDGNVCTKRLHSYNVALARFIYSIRSTSCRVLYWQESKISMTFAL